MPAHRRKRRMADFVLCSDLHLRVDTPACRVDDYRDAQRTKLIWLFQLVHHMEAKLVMGGDVFDRPSPPCDLLEEVIGLMWEHLPRTPDMTPSQEVFVIPGQHDLPYHSMDHYERSGLAVLESAQCVTLLNRPQTVHKGRSVSLKGYGWGVPLEGDPVDLKVAHLMCWEGDLPYPGAPETGNWEQVRRRAGNPPVLLTGDNHRQFLKGSPDDGWVVNPGSFMRMTAEQTDHQPAVYLWTVEGNTIERVPVPCRDSVISREHLDRKKDKDERLDAFVERMGEGHALGFSFRDNLKEYLSGHRVRKGVSSLLWEAVGDE